MFRVFEYLFEKTNVNLNVSNEDQQSLFYLFFIYKYCLFINLHGYQVKDKLVEMWTMIVY